VHVAAKTLSIKVGASLREVESASWSPHFTAVAAMSPEPQTFLPCSRGDLPLLSSQVYSALNSGRLDCPARQSNSWIVMQVQTRFLRLFKPAGIGDRIGTAPSFGHSIGPGPFALEHSRSSLINIGSSFPAK
jgi:hypothetical protein